MARTPKPDILVGIDFGMTCTGVAYVNYAMNASQPLVKWIQRWPGRKYANENKVPSILVYADGEDVPKTWGFEAENFSNHHNMHCVEWFKIFLDPARLRAQQKKDPEGAPASMAEVERFYKEYLERLYKHIETHFTAELYGKTWRDARVDFVFSLPTTWTDKTIVENFRSIIHSAGYRQYPAHTVSLGLTEAEAAAVHVSKEASVLFKQGDTLLVCDAGGGTTDLSVLKVTAANEGSISLKQMDVVFGKNIGSVAIDQDFMTLVKSRLDMANATQPMNLSEEQLVDLARSIMKSPAYQGMKCDFGSTVSSAFDTFFVPAPKLPPNYMNQAHMISNQAIQFARSDFQGLFDKQIGKLIKLIDSQLARLLQRAPSEQVTHLILSGGLGNSSYVQQRLRDQYGPGGVNGFPNAQTMKIYVAPDPQLAVCKGIVADSIQQLSRGSSVLISRCCRESYGTICKELFDGNRHRGRKTERDPLSGKLFVMESIEWFIREGEQVSSNQPLERPFTRRIRHSDSTRTFPAAIVVSRLPRHALPSHKTDDVEVLCDLDANLTGIDKRRFQDVNRWFWQSGKRHYVINFQIKMIINPADIIFELWFQGQKLSKDRSIKVQWRPVKDANEADY